VEDEVGPRPECALDDGELGLLEEQRVSLFAQQLRTPVTISAKRLAEAWTQRGA
jgi:hypothetical protein